MGNHDIVYRHALHIDATGDRLAFGSTTGSLWTTENQGDSWQRLDGSLPPIYGVRFVPELPRLYNSRSTTFSFTAWTNLRNEVCLPTILLETPR